MGFINSFHFWSFKSFVSRSGSEGSNDAIRNLAARRHSFEFQRQIYFAEVKSKQVVAVLIIKHHKTHSYR